MMNEKEQAERIYSMIRGQIATGHDPKLIHSTTMSVCGVMINEIMREAQDENYWYGVKIHLGKIEDLEF